MRNFKDCIGCGKRTGDCYSIRCKTCSNRIISKKKMGSKLSDTTKRKISISVSKFAKQNPDKIFFKKGHKINVGRKYSEERNLKIRGKNSPHWKGGITPTNVLLRHSQEYRLWRKAVFERDDHTCIWCGLKGVELNADHIKSWALFPELRFAIDNGRTLCVPCHETTDSYKKRI